MPPTPVTVRSRAVRHSTAWSSRLHGACRRRRRRTPADCSGPRRLVVPGSAHEGGFPAPAVPARAMARCPVPPRAHGGDPCTPGVLQPDVPSGTGPPDGCRHSRSGAVARRWPPRPPRRPRRGGRGRGRHPVGPRGPTIAASSRRAASARAHSSSANSANAGPRPRRGALPENASGLGESRLPGAHPVPRRPAGQTWPRPCPSGGTASA